MSSKKNGTMKKVWKGIYVLLVLLCLLCIGGMVLYLYGDQLGLTKAEGRYHELLEQFGSGTVPGAREDTAAPDAQGGSGNAGGSGTQGGSAALAGPGTPGAGPETQAAAKAPLPIDFAGLQEINPEIYAWIRIPDTKIDYPIVQRVGEDQGYYLDHDIYGEKQKAGSIYTEHYNSRDFQDPNTIIYGHNMKNGSMFHNLRYFAEAEYFEEHEDLYIYMPDRILKYQIITCYEYDDRHLLGTFDFDDEEVYAEYLETIMNPRSMYTMVREGCELTTEDRIITLSTCVANKPNNRRLLQAVLVEEIEAEYYEEEQN